MGLLQQLKKKLFERKLRSVLKSNRTDHQSVQFAQAKTIGLLFEGTNLDQREQVEKFAAHLKKSGKKVRMMAFMDNKVDNSGFIFQNFNRDDLDFSLCPTKSEEVKQFLDAPLDILINLSRTPLDPLNYIMAGAKARFRVGPYDEAASWYELMIDLPANRKLSDYIKQVEVYLNKMQTTHEAAV
jgi:hypothetical protein